MNQEQISKLIEKLNTIHENKIKEKNVVLLPDFFIDHFLTFKDLKKIKQINEIYNQGGGNIPGIKQKIIQGGNSANTALALAKLGISSHLICKTDLFGEKILKFFLGQNGVDISHVKTNGDIAITTAMEFGENKINIMLGDTGSVSNFTFDIINDSDKELIKKSDLLCLTNWTLNKQGTNLAIDAFRFAKKYNVKTFFDTGDPSSRVKDIDELIESVLKSENLDILALNENELNYYCKKEKENGIEKNGMEFKKNIHARLDVHTSDFSYTFKERCIHEPSIKLKYIFRSTGAGDSWNAGNIFSELIGLNDNERLFFANSLSAYYISSKDAVHPNINQIVDFIGKI